MTERKATNIVWHPGKVTRDCRERLSGHRGFTIWFTGLSASGKSTLAVALEEALYDHGCHAYVLDGDNVRHGLNSNLGFSPGDRAENIRRIAEVAKLFRDAGVISITAFISPYRSDRDSARKLAEAEHDAFIEVFVDCPVEVCEQRDPKGMYRKARAGEIREFTGVTAPYEPPLRPEIHLHTNQLTVREGVDAVMDYLVRRDYIPCAPNEMRTSFRGRKERA
jgi:adenylylsulfate kinase